MTGQFTESLGTRHRFVGMRVPLLIFILINFGATSMALSEAMPSWITKGPVSDSVFHYVICSHDGIDPEEARQIAESKCLASAAKLGGVNVKITQKTIQSLTGSDSSEVAEIQPLEVKIKCEWTDRFLEKIKDGFRVWLRCKVTKTLSSESTLSSAAEIETEAKSNKHVDAILILSTIPQADRIIIVGMTGERVIEPESNIATILVTNLDSQIVVKKRGYKNATFILPKDFKNGGKIQKDFILEKD